MYRSEDGGRTWAVAGLEGEAVRALEQSASQPSTLVAGSRSGVFRSTDDGKTWERISPPGDVELENLDSIAIDPRDPKVIYAGTYHLPWKTTDGGKNWTAIAEGMIDDSDIMSLRIDSETTSRVYASACSGIYRSDDGGAHWTKLAGIPYASRRTQQIVQDPADAKTLYAATTEGLWATRDTGESWQRITPREWVANAVAILPGANGGAARLLLGTEQLGIEASDDAGVHFYASNAGFMHRVVAGIAGEPGVPGHLLIWTTDSMESLLESKDGGATWTPLDGKMPRDKIRRVFGSAAGWWIAQEEGGAARFDEGSKTWKALRFEAVMERRHGAAGKAMPVRKWVTPEVMAIAIAGARVYAATSDGLWGGELQAGVLRRVDEKQIGGAVGDVAFENGLWAATDAAILRSTDEGKTWSEWAAPVDAGRVLWLDDPVIGEPAASSASELVAGTSNGMYRVAMEPGGGWRRWEFGLPQTAVRRLAESDGRFAALVGAGGVFVREPLRTGWTRLEMGNAASALTGIVGDGKGGFYLGSRSEGVLHWEAGK